jgi:hypothetical protein
LKVEGRRGNSRKRWVSDLIDATSRTWNEEAVRECCYPRDVTAILNIKLIARSTEDFIAWSGESSGIFTVRSTYRLRMQPLLHASNNGQSSSEPLANRSVWNLIWKADVPQKLRVFAWRAATGTLAVRSGLHRRISTVDPTCTFVEWR